MTSADAPRASVAAIAVALLIVYVVWGSTYLAIAVMIETLPPLLAAGARFVVAGVLVLGALLAHARWRRARGRGPGLETPTRAHWRSAAIVGTLLLLGGNGGVVLAELRISSGLAAVLVATVPIWLAVFDAIQTRRRPSRIVVGGLIAGIVGVAILLLPGGGTTRIDPIGIGLVVVAAMAWALGSLYARRAPLPRNGLLVTGMEMLAGGGALLLGGLALGELGRIDPDGFSSSSLLALAYLIVFGSIVAFTAYTWLLAHVSVATVGTYAYVNPIVAVALGAVIRSEPVTPRTILAAALIIGAVVAMVSGRSSGRAPDPEPAAATAAPDGGGTDPAARPAP